MVKSIIVISVILTIIKICQATDYQYPIDTGAKCEPYIGDPPTRIICAPYITSYNTSIYVPSGASQTTMQSDADYYVKLLNTYGNNYCKVEATFRTLCSFFFIECIQFKNNTDITNSTSPNVTLAFPVRTCRESCEQSMSLCGISQSQYNCSQTITNDLPTYIPELDTAVFNLTTYGWTGDNNGSLVLECFNTTNPALNTNGSTIDASFCQAPLIFRNTTINNRWHDETIGYSYMSDSSDCLVPCPAPVFTPKQWDSFYTLIDTLSMMSAIASLFMIITYGLLNRDMTNYEKILCCQFTSLFIRALSGVIITFAGGSKHVMCPAPGKSATSGTDPICMASGILFYGFSFNAILWWAYLVFDLWCVVRRIKQLKLLYFGIGSTLFTIGMTIGATIKGKYIADKGNVICWVSDNDYGDGLFWIPMGIFIGLATIFLVWIIIDVRRLVQGANVDWAIAKKFVHAQIGPFVYIVMFYTTYIYIFIYNRTYHLSYQNIRARAAVVYFDCILRSGAEGYDPNSCLVAGPEIGAYSVFTLTLHIFGLYTLFYAFNHKFLAIWTEIYYRVKKSFIYSKHQYLGDGIAMTYTNTNTTSSSGTSGYTSTSSQISTIVLPPKRSSFGVELDEIRHDTKNDKFENVNILDKKLDIKEIQTKLDLSSDDENDNNNNNNNNNNPTTPNVEVKEEKEDSTNNNQNDIDNISFNKE